MADFHRAMDGFSLPNNSERINALDISAAKNWLLNLQRELQQENSGRASVKLMLPLLDGYLNLVARVESEMANLDLSVLKPSVIHGDIHCFNLIFSKDKRQYISILDFDFIREDYRLVDFYWASRSVIWHYAYGEVYGEKPPHDREPPLEKLAQATDFGIQMMVDVYRKHHVISDVELKLLPLFAILMPLYTIRFFSLQNSEDECMRHSEWFGFQLKHIDTNVELITHAIEKALNKNKG
jgi:Ser/Thr protein kinase RdoA (MazF antagonist)